VHPDGGDPQLLSHLNHWLWNLCWTSFQRLRHSLINWLVNKRKENPKTVQGILRHAKIQTTLDLYAESDLEEMQEAQGAFLKEMGMHTDAIQ
jgi:integrase